VKCDREITTQADVAAGVVNVVIGFAPLKRAEFVIISNDNYPEERWSREEPAGD
jgi:hypothetical protein